MAAYRRIRGLSQQELARRADISVAALRDLEQGRTRRPSSRSLRALGAALDIDPAVLFEAAGEVGPRRPASPAAAVGTLRVEVLGPLRVRRGDTDIPLGRDRRRALLGLLALSVNQTVSVRELVDVLWEGRPPHGASRLLQADVSRLRAALEPVGPRRGVLTRVNGGYRLQLAADELDLVAFRALVHRAAAADAPQARALLDAALDLWRGVPLADIGPLENHPLITGIAEERISALLRSADLASAAGCPDHALPRLREQAAAHPLHEPLHVRLITALAGKQAEALDVYEGIRRRLAENFGVSPGAELAGVHRQVLRQELPVPVPIEPAVARSDVPAQLPRYTTHFVGRREELTRLDAVLADEDTSRSAVVVVSGSAGIGKTTLAIRWAHQIREQFPDGQLYMDLRGYDPAHPPLDAAEVIRRFLETLGISGAQLPADAQTEASLYRTLLADRRLLLILDNARDAEQIRPLLPGAVACVVVVTSRDPLAGLIASDGAYALPLNLLGELEARELLTQRIGSARADAEPYAIAQIVSSCGGLPIAMAIVAARLLGSPAVSLAGLAAELSDVRRRLDALTTGDVRTDIRAVLSSSYDTLSAPARQLHRLLGLHPCADFSVPAAAALAGHPIDQVRPLLAELERARLIEEEPTGRYLRHELARIWSTELTMRHDLPSTRHAAERRLADHLAAPTGATSVDGPSMEMRYRPSAPRSSYWPRIRWI